MRRRYDEVRGVGKRMKKGKRVKGRDVTKLKERTDCREEEREERGVKRKLFGPSKPEIITG